MSELTRDKIADEYKWNLGAIYNEEKDFENEIKKVLSLVEKFKKCKGKLKENVDFINIIEDLLTIFRLREKIYIYANLKYCEDTTNSIGQELKGKAEDFFNKVLEELSFFKTEILDLDFEKLVKVLKDNNKETYIRLIEDYFRYKKYTLSPTEEQLLASINSLFSAPNNIFGGLNDADVKFENILIENEEVILTQSNYSNYIEHPDRNVRKQAFESMMNFYKNHINTISSIYNAFVNGNNIRSRLRGFNSYLECCLYNNEINPDIYNNLIEVANKNLNIIHNYYKIKKDTLGLDKLHLYDMYVPIIEGFKENITFDEAFDRIRESLKILGKDYITNMEKSIVERWIDIYPSKGKRSGAFQSGGYNTSPYILVNFENNLSSAKTLAHELGHAMHTYYSIANQDYANYDYTIFVAEVASTVNEILYLKKEIELTDSTEKKKYLYTEFFDKFDTTFFRQTMFAEFEKITYEKKANGEILNATLLCDIYEKLTKKYYGENIVVDELGKYIWARIPHFYKNFYVYQYATGFSAACALTNKILQKDEEAINKYLNFLKSGSTKDPISLLKDAGVDMSTSKPIEEALKMFNDLQKEYKKLK